MEAHDRRAMELAIEMARADSEKQRWEIDDMLRTQPWQQVAEFAVWRCQDRSLKLRPWECPPFLTRNVEDPSDCWGHRPQEVALLRRMLAVGVSRFHPEPLAAIAAAGAERAAS
jgi:hypothetical protein